VKPATRAPRRRLDGVLLLDKPGGLSSNTALQRARGRFRAAKAGHGGTLDPMASGLLPVLFGEATKFSGWMLDAGKTYLATVRLGERTDTGDAEGRITAVRPVAVDDATLEKALEAFRGEILQVPPMHSALKRDGKPLYELARQGIEVERQPRRVRIERLVLTGRAGDLLDLEVACSKGTYIRTLAADLGEALGCGAHLSALRRTVVGRFDVRDAWTLERLDALPEAGLDAVLLPADVLVQGLAAVTLADDPARRFRHGQAVDCGGNAPGMQRVYGPGGAFLGLGERLADGLIQPLRLVAESAQPADNHQKNL
jgi:tRNA pseudouridine55 synthase